jgi:hypothetical protein
MITTVIFDLDDTLYDGIDFCRTGFRAAASRMAALSDDYSVEAVFAALWNCFLTGERDLPFDLALTELGILCDGSLIHKLADNETKDFIVPNRLGLLTVRLLRPSALYRQPSSRADAAPRVKIAAIGEWAGLPARFAERT